MPSRIFSTLLLWFVVAVAIVLGGAAGWEAVLWALAAGAAAEACAISEKMGHRPMKACVQAATFFIMWAECLPFGGSGLSGASATAVACGLMLVSLLANPYGAFWEKSLLPSLLVILAVPFALQWLVYAAFEYGVMFSVMILAVAKFSDVGAFVFGKAFGRRKLSPEISPKKTLEGAIGGVFSSVSVAAAFAWCCNGTSVFPKNFMPTDALWIGAVIGVAAIVSDLIESVYKRRAGVKDSGGVIPGIGGALDLADSVLLSAPFGVLLAALANVGG